MPRMYVELSIVAPPAAIEIMSGALTTEGFEGFWEEGGELRAYTPAEGWDEGRLEGVRLKLAEIARALGISPPAVACRSLPEENWNLAWEKSIRPIRAGERIIIAPSWHPWTPVSGEVVLTIDPKMSFGTGHHESTRLLLALTERYTRPGTRVLDAGTGTGVIAIAALRLGASSAIAFDTDEWAARNAAENARLNGVADRLSVRQGDLSTIPESGFDLICTNIQVNVIQGMLSGLTSRLARGGTLIVSGLLDADHPGITASMREAGLTIVEERSEGEWRAYAARFP